MSRLKFVSQSSTLVRGCWDTMESTVCDLSGPTEPDILKRYVTHDNSYKLIFETLSFAIINPNDLLREVERTELLSVTAPLLLDRLDKFYYASVRSHIEKNILTKERLNITLLGNVFIPVVTSKEATLLDIFSVVMLMYAISPELPTIQEDSIFVKERYLTSLAYASRTTEISSAEYMAMNRDTLGIKSWLLNCLNLEDESLKSMPTNDWVAYVFNAIKYLGLCGLFAHQSRYTFTDGYDRMAKVVFVDLIRNVK